MAPTCKYYCYKKNIETMNYNKGKVDKIELIFFDMDGVLTDTISSWKHVHDYFGTSNERSVDEYLKGNIDDLEFIKRDVSLWKESDRLTSKNVLQNILSDIPLMKGAEKCISFLRENKIKTAIVSAGLDILADSACARTHDRRALRKRVSRRSLRRVRAASPGRDLTFAGTRRPISCECRRGLSGRNRCR